MMIGESNISRSSTSNDDFVTELQVIELLKLLWNSKKIIFFISLFSALFAGGVALYLPNVYRAEALLVPSKSDPAGSGLAAIAGQLGGLANLAGINIGQSGNEDKSALAIQVMKSRQFTGAFIRAHDLLPDLMAVKKWDRNSNKIIYDSSLYLEESKTWVRDVKPPKSVTPSLQEAHEELVKILTISQDEKTGFVKVSIEHQSPYIAKQWVDWLISDVNTEIMHRDVTEAERSIAFLEQQIQKSSVANMHTIFYKLIEEQTKTIIFANVRDEYVFKTIDPALVTEEKERPKRAIIVGLGLFLGILISIVYVLFRLKVTSG